MSFLRMSGALCLSAFLTFFGNAAHAQAQLILAISEGTSG